MADAAGEVEEIRPCLIGGFRGKNDTSGLAGLLPASTYGVPRCDPYVAPEGSVVSLDMVRVKLKFSGDCDSVARFEDKVQRLHTLRESFSMGRSTPGRFAHLYTLEYGSSTVTLGVGQFVKGVQADMNRGFCEFNPNKVGGSEGFADFLQLVGSAVQRSELVRYDLAVDLPVDRSHVRTRKDRRRYEFMQGATLTEYLGARNTVGRVKVYDKAAELGLDGGELTRVEVTCSGQWSVEQVLDKWPTVYRLNDADGDASDVNAALGLMALELAEYGESPEKYLKRLNRHRAAKVRKLIEGAQYGCPVAGAARVLIQATAWADRLAGAE